MCLDTFSYLLGKKKGGGGGGTGVKLTVNPSTTDTTYTPEAGTYYNEVEALGVTSSIDANITASNIKNGVSILGVTGNLAVQDWSLIGYEEAPIVEDVNFQSAKAIYDGWDSSVTSGNDMFKYGNLLYFPNVDTSNMTTMKNMFQYSLIQEIENIDMSACTNAENMFQGSNIRYIKELLPLVSCNMKNTLASCSKLTRIKKLRISNNSSNQYIVSSAENLLIDKLLMNGSSGNEIFYACTNLDIIEIVNEDGSLGRNHKFCNTCTFTNRAMDEILKYFKTLIGQSSNYKTLLSMGFTSDNATQATQSQYWQDLVDAGWSTGY